MNAFWNFDSLEEWRNPASVSVATSQPLITMIGGPTKGGRCEIHQNGRQMKGTSSYPSIIQATLHLNPQPPHCPSLRQPSSPSGTLHTNQGEFKSAIFVRSGSSEWPHNYCCRGHSGTILGHKSRANYRCATRCTSYVTAYTVKTFLGGSKHCTCLPASNSLTSCKTKIKTGA